MSIQSTKLVNLEDAQVLYNDLRNRESDLKSALNLQDKVNVVSMQRKSEIPFVASDFVVGTLSDLGAEMESTTRIRTGFIPVSDIRILKYKADTGYTIRYFSYDVNKNFISKQDYESELTVTLNSAMFVRFVLKKTDDSTISTAAYNKIHVSFENPVNNAKTNRWEMTTVLSNSSNLNNYRTPGNYYVSLSSISGLTNYPSDTPGKLTISTIDSSSNVKQELELRTGPVYTRCYINSVWTEWKRTATRDEVQPIGEKEEILELLVGGRSAAYPFTQSMWEHGSLGSNGAEIENNARIRTKYVDVLSTKGFSVSVDDGYEWMMVAFSSSKSKVTDIEWTSEKTVFTLNSAKYIRFALRNANALETELPLSDYSKIHVNFLNRANTAPTLIYNMGALVTNGSDMDNYKGGGNYYVPQGAVPTLTHYPSDTGGRLTVSTINADDHIKQQIDLHTGYTYTRYYVNSAWTSWKRIATRDDIENTPLDFRILELKNGQDNTLRTIITDWVSGNIKDNGTEEASNKNIRSVYVPVKNGDTVNVVAADGYSIKWCSYLPNKSIIGADVYADERMVMIYNAAYFRIVLKKNDGSDITVNDFDKVKIRVWQSRKSIPTFGKANFAASAKQITDIKWTPVAEMPVYRNGRTTIQAGVTQTGFPYSSTRDIKKYVGSDVSIYTFMSALANPKSVLYTRIITVGTMAASYYGCVCDQYANYALGIKGCYRANRTLIRDYCEEIEPLAVEIGDLLMTTTMNRETHVNPGHCLLVSYVAKDEYGRVKLVEISELSGGGAIKTSYTLNAYLELFDPEESDYPDPYKLYRPKKIDGTGYEKSDFVKGYPDETITSVTFPDIMPEYGDLATIEAGTDVTINILNARSYTSINIYKNDTLIDTKTTIDDFTIEDMSYGTYKFELTDGTNTSYSTMIVSDVNGSYNSETGIVTFSSENCVPLLAESYSSNATDPGNSGLQNLQHEFTVEEITAGQADVSSLVGTKCPYIRVMFLNEYGSTKWDSYPLDDQWEEWSPT